MMYTEMQNVLVLDLTVVVFQEFKILFELNDNWLDQPVTLNSIYDCYDRFHER